MVDGSNENPAGDANAEKAKQGPPAKAVSAAEAFVRAHGGSARAVVENIGQAGVRVVLVGEDGMLGDVMVPDVETGQELAEAVDGLTPSDWDTDTVAALQIGSEHRRKMAGPRAR